MTKLLTTYRVLATVVGILLIPLFAGWGVEIFGSGVWHDRAETLTEVLGPIHGLLYMLFFVTAVILSFKAEWDLPFTLVTLVSGTVVFLSFWAERRATARVRADHSADRLSTSSTSE